MSPELLKFLTEDERESLAFVSDLDPGVEGWEKLAEARKHNADRESRRWCAYCGHEQELDADGSLITTHILECEKHPIKVFRDALATCNSVRIQLREAAGSAAEHYLLTKIFGNKAENKETAQAVVRDLKQALAANDEYEKSLPKEGPAHDEPI